MNKDFNDLYVFLTIVQVGNFSRAAKKLGVSPSALSHAMNALEARLGVKLLNRTTRSVSATDAGQQLFARITPLFDAIRDEVQDLGRFRDTTVGKVRINASENTAVNIIYPKLRAFLPRHPELQIELFMNNERVDIVAERFDLGVRSGSDVAQDMIAIRIAPDLPMITVAAPAYLAAHGIPQSPEDLPQHHCIGLSLNSQEHIIDWYYMHDGKEIKAAISCPLIFNSNQLGKMAALDGMGIAWLPWLMVEKEIADGRLVEILRDYRATYPGAYLYFSKSRQRSAALQALIAALRWEESGA
jgi:hypothetical transcriptional regulator ycjZ